MHAPTAIRTRSAVVRAAGLAIVAAVLVTTPTTSAAQVPGPLALGDALAVGVDGTCEMTRTGEYGTAAPDEVGMDAAALGEALAYATMHGSETIKVFRAGCLVGEGDLDPLYDRVPRQNWSQTKTVAALVTGIAADLAYIDLDVSIGTYLPEGLCSDEHREPTLRNLLQMSAGHDMNWTRGVNFFTDNSRFREYCTMEMVHEPGTFFEYDQHGPSVVIYVVQQAIWANEPGLDFQDFAQRELFDYLGIPQSAYWWQRDRAGNTLGYSQLFLRPLEFGRLGELMLNDGEFDGVQVVSSDFIHQLHQGSPTNCGYGLFVWVNSCQPGDPQFTGSIFQREPLDGVPWIASAPADMYYTWGYHGQHTFVIPSLDMVITRSGEQQLDTQSGAMNLDGDALIAGEQRAGYHELFRLLMAAVVDMPADVEASIVNSGPWEGSPSFNLDLNHFLYPVDAFPGSFLSIGPGAPEGCDMTGCEGEANDGLQTWLGDVPRTVPGIAGAEDRPDPDPDERLPRHSDDDGGNGPGNGNGGRPGGRRPG